MHLRNCMELTKEYLDKNFASLRKDFKDQTKALMEYFGTQVKVIAEQYGAITGDIYGIKNQLVGIQEKVDKIDLLEVDLRTIKDDVAFIKVEIEVVKDMLTDKVDQETHQALSQRVYALEQRAGAS